MKKTTLSLLLTSVLAVSAVAPVAYAEKVVSNDVAYTEIVTKRQVVDTLLSQALTAFKSPARVSHAGFTAKMPSNMEIVTNRLLTAYELEPYRTDLVISAANAQIYNKNVDRAIELFEQGLTVAPDDLDINSYLAAWTRFNGDAKASSSYMKKVAQLNAGRASDLERIFSSIDRIVATPLKEKAVSQNKKKTAIVTLGYALNPDGSMHDILIERLETTLDMAKKDPKAMVVLTGGVPQNNKTEGRLMAQWLIERGLDASRIIEENYATSTVDNALYSTYALARHDIEHATIISSASHVRRGQALFEISSWQTGPTGITFDTVAYPDKPLSELKDASSSELLGIYRDALRTYGMWSYRSYPLQSR